MTIPIPDRAAVLSSWKDIARYTGKGVRTVQRWEKDFGLPVRRPTGSSAKSAVFIYACELDAWSAERALRHRMNRETAPTCKRSELRSSGLAESIRTAKQLRASRRILSAQIGQSVRKLAENCEVMVKSKPGT